MMNHDEKAVVMDVYSHLMQSETDGWSDLDDNLEFMELLTDQELMAESIIKRDKHQANGIRCKHNHPPEQCVAMLILEAVDAILKLYQETKELHIKNRYIVLYYLAMSEMKLIF